MTRHRWRTRGTRPRGEFAPADLMRGVERDRARFMDRLEINISPWRIARILQRKMEGDAGEGLRGIYAPDDDGPGTIYWWPSTLGSHHQGRLMLKLDADRASGRLLEVEANVDDDRTIYLCWSDIRCPDKTLPDRFLSHPSIGTLINGCLARNGRILRIDALNRGLRLVPEGAVLDSPQTDRAIRRTEKWQALMAEALAWTRTRRETLPDDRRTPPKESLRPYRLWLENILDWYAEYPPPAVSINPDGAIVARWRATDKHAIMTFRDHSVGRRTIEHGSLTEHDPVTIRTQRQMIRKGPSMIDIVFYRGDGEDT